MLPPKGWTYSPLFRDVDTALRSGFSNPDEFWALPESIQAVLTVYWETKDSMRYVEEREASKKYSGKGSKDTNKD